MDAAGSVSRRVYDATGNLLEEIDPNNNPSTHHSYDALNRLIKTTDRLSGVAEYQYNLKDHLLQVKAPNGATTLSASDATTRPTTTSTIRWIG